VQRAIARDIDLGFLLEHAQIAGDPVLLSELLDNLIDNALRYTPRGGAVTVRCGPDSGRSYLSVEDTGPGIPPSAHGRVFERFYRIQGTPGDGTGLGLAIVKEVAQRHGASLSIETPDAGRSGTRVVVRFPAATPSAPESANSERRARPTAEV
jgi:two-component system sensor histidine kinase TctE